MADVDELAQTEYGRLKHFKVVRPDPQELGGQVKIEIELNGTKIVEWAEITMPEEITVYVAGVRESEYNTESSVAAAVLLKLLGTAVHSPPRSQRAARGRFMAITITQCVNQAQQ